MKGAQIFILWVAIGLVTGMMVISSSMTVSGGTTPSLRASLFCMVGKDDSPKQYSGIRPNQGADLVSASLDEIVRQSLNQENNYYGVDVTGGEAQSSPPSSAVASGQNESPSYRINNNLQQRTSSQPTEKPTLGEFSYNEEDLSQVDKDLIFEGLKQLYYKKVLPLEVASKFAHFASPPMGPSDFDAKPMVLILGQYSVGKTSFIRSLLQQDFPGQRIGPEPTTDRFTAIMHSGSGSSNGVSSDRTLNSRGQQNFHSELNNQQNRLLPGHALVMQHNKPFRGLASFGNNFLSKFEGAEVNADILRNITIVDTPGVLAGEKQRLGRDYDFSEVIKWFAERADMIIIMFDAHKLDISDELRSVLDTLKPHQEKIRVLLNKADTIDTQSLLRVYGALMWSLGKVVQTPEVCRVYLGSFWEAPLKLEDNRALLEREKRDLLNEMMSLPQGAVVRRINELVKRARSVKVHAYILHYLKKQMPYVIGRSDKQRKLLDRLDREFVNCARRYNLPIGDFPNVDAYRKILREIKDISDFKRLDKNLVYEMDRVLTHDIPLLLQRATSRGNNKGSKTSGGAAISDGANNNNGDRKTVAPYSLYNNPLVKLAQGFTTTGPSVKNSIPDKNSVDKLASSTVGVGGTELAQNSPVLTQSTISVLPPPPSTAPLYSQRSFVPPPEHTASINPQQQQQNNSPQYNYYPAAAYSRNNRGQ